LKNPEDRPASESQRKSGQEMQLLENTPSERLPEQWVVAA